MDLKRFATETRNPNSENLDMMSALEIVTLMNQEDRKVCLAIEEAGGNAKLAITKILTGTDMVTAKELLEQAKGHVRVAIQLAQEKK